MFEVSRKSVFAKINLLGVTYMIQVGSQKGAVRESSFGVIGNDRCRMWYSPVACLVILR